MKRNKISWVVLCVAALVACEASAPPAPTAKRPDAPAKDAGASPKAQNPKAQDPQIDLSNLPDLEYIEFVTGPPDKGEPLPMIVMIHGLGDRPENMRGLFVPAYTKPARIILPRGPEAYGGGFSWFPVVEPIEGGDAAMVAGMARSAAAVAKLLKKLRVRRPTIGKPIVSGFSQGGMLSFVLAARHPDVVGTAVPIAGWLPPALLPDKGAPIAPIQALHGGEDPLVKLEPTRASVASLTELGADATIQVFPKVRHSFTRTMQVQYFNILREALIQGDQSEDQ